MKTQDSILEVIAENSGTGISSSEIRNKLVNRGINLTYGTIASYLKLISELKLVTRVAKRTDPNRAWSYLYRIDFTEVTQ